MNSQAIFYALNQKFLDSKDKVPEQAQQVMYYSLSIGHHVGVIDCLKRILSCPLTGYRQWIDQLPEGEARRKMAGLMKFGEIVIDSSHAGMLGRAFSRLSDAGDAYPDWTATLLAYLLAIERETALYLMVRRIDD
ncbi:formate hydrogenlyase maturation HycH family protein [Brenneria populi]|uniref:Formate hydrogenlyase maturation HycH family protein n=1 Tax=Brenneria populi TaxID=1505588 RepID=A0ABU6JV67_9GAMM|nr:formate hydrogenlyase maturation HycH family protein [Brenneria populi Li et al. 2015]